MLIKLFIDVAKLIEEFVHSVELLLSYLHVLFTERSLLVDYVGFSNLLVVSEEKPVKNHKGQDRYKNAKKERKRKLWPCYYNAKERHRQANPKDPFWRIHLIFH